MSLRSWSVAVCCLLVLAGCSEDSPDPSSASPVGAPSPEQRLDCVALVPDDAVVALGWAVGDPAEEDADRCLRRVDDSGVLTVRTEPDLQEACDRLRSEAGEVTEPVDWLEPTREESCVTGLDVGTGVAELVFVNDTDEVVQVRVEARRSVTADQLRAAFGALADAAREDVVG